MKLLKSFSFLLIYCVLSAFSAGTTTELSSSCRTITANPTTTPDVVPGATNIILQSKDGGQTWEDISQGLPHSEQPEDFFAGESDVYLRVGDVTYRSKSNLKTPVWEIETGLFSQSVSIAFNRSGVMAYNYEGEIFQKTPAGKWVPAYANFKKHSMRTVFETSDGTIFLGYDHGLYKSADRGQNWKQVQNGGWVMDIVESKDVLVATGQKGIMRSTDKGEHWELVISEGGVGIAIERIEGGFAAISFNTTTQSRRVRISTDNGKTWKAIDEGLHPSLFTSSIIQSGKYLLCGHPDGIFSSSDMGKTWNIVHQSAESPFKISIGDTRNKPGRVFNLYVSGNIVYAVAKSAGC